MGGSQRCMKNVIPGSTEHHISTAYLGDQLCIPGPARGCSSPCSQQQWPAEDKPDEEPDRSKQELKKNKNKNFLKSRGDWERKPLGSKARDRKEMGARNSNGLLQGSILIATWKQQCSAADAPHSPGASRCTAPRYSSTPTPAAPELPVGADVMPQNPSISLAKRKHLKV